MKGRRYILLTFAVCWIHCSYGQTWSYSPKQVLDFSTIEKPRFVNPVLGQQKSLFDLRLLHPNLVTPMVFRSPDQELAFFCKMEVKAVDALGIWIKVRVGDPAGFFIQNCSSYNPFQPWYPGP